MTWSSRAGLGRRGEILGLYSAFISWHPPYVWSINLLPSPDHGGDNACMLTSVTITPLFLPSPKPSHLESAPPGLAFLAPMACHQFHLAQSFTLLIGRYLPRQPDLVLTTSSPVLSRVRARRFLALAKVRLMARVLPQRCDENVTSVGSNK